MPGPDPAKARRRYDRYAPTYDRQLALLRSFQNRIRRDAIARLGLRSGDTVLDVGCGTGASLPHLVAAVGSAGRVVAIDQSGGMLAQARHRVESAGWVNVELIEAPVQEAAIPGGVDAALLFFTHDLLRTPAALGNVVGSLRPGGRIATAGARRPPAWLVPLALPLLALMRRYVTTTEGLDRPWDLLAEQVGSMDVELRLLGAVYLAVGATPRQGQP
jgi:demethylmenaquinone methyltransferase/2-methoxy-6-polyprenyl-1,4-benzoquinol methylase